MPIAQSLGQPKSLHLAILHPVQPVAIRANPKRTFVIFMHGLYLVRGQALPLSVRLEEGRLEPAQPTSLRAHPHIAFLIGHRNRVIVMLQWWWAYTTFHRGARLITGREHTAPGVAFPAAERPRSATPPPQRMPAA